MSDIKLMEETTNAIIKARRVLAEAKEQVTTCKEVLKDIETKMILHGLGGKNKEERDAHIWQATSPERRVLADAEKRERAAILELEVCKDIRRCQENIIAIENMKEA